MFHQFKYSLKILFGNKFLIFWTYIFPILLSTMFYFAFSNITSDETFDVVDVAIVDNADFRDNEVFVNAFKTMSEGENKLFNISYVDEEEAGNLLSDSKIVGYLKLSGEDVDLTFNDNGVSESIFKMATSEVLQTSKLISTLMEDAVSSEIAQGNYILDYNQMSEKIVELVNSEYEFNDISGAKMDYAVIEFYTLIAMTCLYGGILGMAAINNCLANMSNKGKRVSVSSTSKLVNVFSSLFSGYFAQVLGLVLLFLYTIFVLKVDFGSNLPLIVLTGFVGSFAGLSLGLFIGSVFRINDGAKTGIMIGYTMIGCFFSGMFGMTMKYIIDTKIPIINKVNPTSMVTDAFYSLYYYETLDRYWYNIISLLIFAFVLIFISNICLRRQKYDSI